ncbi:hypothetical protein AVEN_42850-1 [Araneus ventricosus]|uniref:Uncharacterized protein n=1 Tax=Araneus ventricosus TaxID=182803 RepID=A0A4Y2AEV3_ARAVE|nr:hypothetical protein AVEN_42850-1 [Araneus ventricosus]
MWTQLREKEEIKDDVLIDDFLSLDSDVETSETLTELDILDGVKNKKTMQQRIAMKMKMEMIMMHKSANLRMMKCLNDLKQSDADYSLKKIRLEGFFGVLQRCETYYERKYFFKQKNSDKINRLY